MSIFKAGDRVRLNQQYDAHPKGDKATVIESFPANNPVDGEMVKVRWDSSGLKSGAYAFRLELDKTEVEVLEKRVAELEREVAELKPKPPFELPKAVGSIVRFSRMAYRSESTKTGVAVRTGLAGWMLTDREGYVKDREVQKLPFIELVFDAEES